MGGRACWVLAIAALLCACGDDETPRSSATASSSASSGGGEACPPGEWPLDGACHPAGLPPDWVEPGPNGEVEAGVPPEACAVGFAPDDDGGCEPILPTAPCPEGLLALPGETTCHEVAPCAAGTWGDIPVEADTEYVDAAYPGGDSDGSAAKPWTTVQAAVDAAAAGAIVAVAAGSYAEDVTVSGKPVRLRGRCPALVELVGISIYAGLLIDDAPAAEVQGFALRAGGGVYVMSSPGARLSHLWLHDIDGPAVWLLDEEPADVEVLFEDSLIERATGVAVVVGGSSARLEGLALRDTQPPPGDSYAHGIEIVYHYESGVGARAVIERSLVERQRGIAVLVADSELSMHGSVVRDTLDDGVDGGAALVVYRLEPTAQASATLEASVLSNGVDRGVATMGADLTLKDCVVRDTVAGQSDLGIGVYAGGAEVSDARGRLVMRSSRIARSQYPGIQVQDADATLEHVHVTDSGQAGILGALFPDANGAPVVDVRYSVVERSTRAGIMLRSATGTVEDTVVRDTVGEPGGFGAGIAVVTAFAEAPASVVAVRRCSVEHNEVFGINVTGSEANVEATRVSDTLPHPSGYQGIGLAIFREPDTMAAATVTLTGSVIEKSRERGVVVLDSHLTVEASVIQDTLVSEVDGGLGFGIEVQTGTTDASSASVRWSVLQNNRTSGIQVAGGDITLEGTLVTDQQADESGRYGACVGALTHPDSGLRSSVNVLGSRLQRCPHAGLVADGADTVVTGTAIADIDSMPQDGRFGRCVSAQAGATLQLASSALERCRDANVVIIDSSATIEDTTIVQALPRVVDGLAGDGLSIVGTSPVAIRRARIADSARAGVAVFGAAVSLEQTVLECNPIHLNAEALDGPASLEDLGGNVCGCGDAEVSCVAVSSSLSPPEPLPP